MCGIEIERGVATTIIPCVSSPLGRTKRQLSRTLPRESLRTRSNHPIPSIRLKTRGLGEGRKLLPCPAPPPTTQAQHMQQRLLLSRWSSFPSTGPHPHRLRLVLVSPPTAGAARGDDTAAAVGERGLGDGASGAATTITARRRRVCGGGREGTGCGGAGSVRPGIGVERRWEVRVR